MSTPPNAPHARPPEDAKREMLGGMAVSLAVHFAIIVSVIIGTISGAEAVEEKVQEEMAPFTPVELVRLGEERPPDDMPEIYNPPAVAPDPVEDDAINLAKKPKDKKPKKKKEPPPEKKKPKKEQVKRPTPPRDTTRRDDAKPSARDILAGFNDPTLPVNNKAPRGHKEGVVGGTIDDPAFKHLLRTYQARIMSDVLRRWRVPNTITAEDAKKLSAAVFVRIGADGHVLTYRMTKRSGNPHFDMSVERAVKAFQSGGARFTMPTDPRLKEAVLSKGLSLRRWKYTGR